MKTEISLEIDAATLAETRANITAGESLEGIIESLIKHLGDCGRIDTAANRAFIGRAVARAFRESRAK